MNVRTIKKCKIQTEEDFPEVKCKIIKAAQELFVKKGYHNTSIPEIVRKAGISTGSIYHYFSSKEALAKEIHDHSVRLLALNFQENILIYPTAQEQVLAFIKLMFEWVENDPILVEYLLFSRPQDIFDERTTICSKEGLSLVMGIIEFGQLTQEIKEGNGYAFYAVLSGTTSRYIQLYLENKLEPSLIHFINIANEIIWNAIKR